MADSIYNKNANELKLLIANEIEDNGFLNIHYIMDALEQLIIRKIGHPRVEYGE